MQQVKKQLQDAIAELKSGWGINEVKREDLAAVLEKVVAALDRAAQLPEPDGSGDFDKYFCRTVVGTNVDFPSGIINSNCPTDSYPALYVYETGPCKAYTCFFSIARKSFYYTDKNGRRFEDVANGRILYNRKSIFTIREDGVLIGTNGEEISDRDYVREKIKDAGWEI